MCVGAGARGLRMNREATPTVQSDLPVWLFAQFLPQLVGMFQVMPGSIAALWEFRILAATAATGLAVVFMVLRGHGFTSHEFVVLDADCADNL